jgi:two-component system CheB/CheR fusion protein
LVDDNVDAVEAIARLLKLDGHVTELALNGLVVFDAVRRFLPDVVL